MTVRTSILPRFSNYILIVALSFLSVRNVSSMNGKFVVHIIQSNCIVTTAIWPYLEIFFNQGFSVKRTCVKKFKIVEEVLF